MYRAIWKPWGKLHFSKVTFARWCLRIVKQILARSFVMTRRINVLVAVFEKNMVHALHGVKVVQNWKKNVKRNYRTEENKIKNATNTFFHHLVGNNPASFRVDLSEPRAQTLEDGMLCFFLEPARSGFNLYSHRNTVQIVQRSFMQCA